MLNNYQLFSLLTETFARTSTEPASPVMLQLRTQTQSLYPGSPG